MIPPFGPAPTNTPAPTPKRAFGKLRQGLHAKSRVGLAVRGETLTEVLASIVISGLAILMLAMVISAASSMIDNSRTAMADYYDQNNQTVEHGGETGSGSVTLTDTTGGTVGLGDGSSTNVTYSIGETLANGSAVTSYEEAD